MNYSTVIAHFGSAYQLSRAIGVTPSAVYAWKGRIPAHQVAPIQALMRKPWTPKGEIRPQLRARATVAASEASASE